MTKVEMLKDFFRVTGDLKSTVDYFATDDLIYGVVLAASDGTLLECHCSKGTIKVLRQGDLLQGVEDTVVSFAEGLTFLVVAGLDAFIDEKTV